MLIITYLLLVIYCLSITCILLYCFLQLDLWILYHQLTPTFNPPPLENYPFVTIQLPIYNEQYVVNRLLDNIIKMDYPSDRLQIQILDDSTDSTTDMIRQKLLKYTNTDIQIVHLHRVHREGFKAGALRDALPSCQGEYIAIFDADFLPSPNFLKETLPYFHDPKIAIVQGRWMHLNERYSILTRLQALQLNVHFTLEQGGRQNGALFLQFNGTAGIWRKTAIIEAGGWQADTLTEDLDLSYRVQLGGGRVKYLENLAVASELPVEMNGLKTQQFRWMKGGAENARQLLRQIWRQNLPLRTKIHATQHLLASTIFLMLFIAAILSLGLLYLLPLSVVSMPFCKLNLLSFSVILLLILNANLKENIIKTSYIQSLLEIIAMIPIFIPMMMGLSLHNSIAVVDGWLHKKSDFIRTPKYNIQQDADAFRQKQYLPQSLSIITFLEMILSIVFFAAAFWGVHIGFDCFWIFHFYMGLGLGLVSLLSIYHLRH